jgi:Ca2+-binding RTX toxin-like protein
VKGTQPFAVVTGDFDRDGNLDILSADAATNTLSLFLGRGNGNFRSPSQFFVGSNPVALVTGDFNEDGKLDIATGNLGATSENITVLLGDGDGSFSSSKLLSAGGSVNSLTVQDLNGDGHLDLAATLNNSALLSTLTGDGDGNFTQLGLASVNSAAQGLTAADLNQDGKIDWVSASSSVNVAVTLNKTPHVLLRSSSKLAEVDASQETGSSIKVDLTKETLIVNSSPSVQLSVKGFDDVLGSQLKDQITGSSQANRLSGNAGRDRLIGNAGDDQLTGGTGRDQLTGSSGKDRFIFDDGVAFSATTDADRITDFESGGDKLVLDRSMFVGLGNRVSFATVKTLEQASSSTAKITYIRTTGRLYYNSDGATPGFGSGGLFALLSGPLTQRDFSTQR